MKFDRETLKFVYCRGEVHMLKTEVKICKKCGKPYMWSHGGIVATPRDYADCGLCTVCRANSVAGNMKKITDMFLK